MGRSHICCICEGRIRPSAKILISGYGTKIHAKCAVCPFCNKGIGNSAPVTVTENTSKGGGSKNIEFYHQECFRCNTCKKIHKTYMFDRITIYKRTVYCVECVPCVFCSKGGTNWTIENTTVRVHIDCLLDAKCKRCHLTLLSDSTDLVELETNRNPVHNTPCSGKLCPVCLSPLGYLFNNSIVITASCFRLNEYIEEPLTVEHLGFLMHRVCGNRVHSYCCCENGSKYDIQRFIHGTSSLLSIESVDRKINRLDNRVWSPLLHDSFSTEIQEAIMTVLLLNRYPRSNQLQSFAMIPREILHMIFRDVALPFSWKQFNGHLLSEVCTDYRCSKRDGICKLCNTVIPPYPYDAADIDSCMPGICSIYRFKCFICETLYKWDTEEVNRLEKSCTNVICINHPRINRPFVTPQNTVNMHYTRYLTAAPFYFSSLLWKTKFNFFLEKELNQKYWPTSEWISSTAIILWMLLRNIF